MRLGASQGGRVQWAKGCVSAHPRPREKALSWQRRGGLGGMVGVMGKGICPAGYGHVSAGPGRAGAMRFRGAWVQPDKAKEEYEWGMTGSHGRYSLCEYLTAVMNEGGCYGA